MKKSGKGTPRCRGEISASSRLWMITLTAKLASRSATKLAPRSGRKAIRSISTAATVPRQRRRHDLHGERKAGLVPR